MSGSNAGELSVRFVELLAACAVGILLLAFLRISDYYYSAVIGIVISCGIICGSGYASRFSVMALFATVGVIAVYSLNTESNQLRVMSVTTMATGNIAWYEAWMIRAVCRKRLLGSKISPLGLPDVFANIYFVAMSCWYSLKLLSFQPIYVLHSVVLLDAALWIALLPINGISIALAVVLSMSGRWVHGVIQLALVMLVTICVRPILVSAFFPELYHGTVHWIAIVFGAGMAVACVLGSIAVTHFMCSKYSFSVLCKK